MLYESYMLMRNMTYEEFKASVISGYYEIALWLVIVGLAMFIIGKWSRYKLNPEENRKLKQICRWEQRPVRYQVKHIIEMFIEAYTEKNDINWEQRLY